MKRSSDTATTALWVLAACAVIAGGLYTVSFPWWRHSPVNDETAWVYPRTLPQPDSERNRLIRYGWELMENTPQHLGPDVPEAAMRICGNRLSCASCHIDGGTAPTALGLVYVSHKFPTVSARSGQQSTLAQRINGCFERSMNGKKLAGDSREMKAMVAYLDWLGSEAPAKGEAEAKRHRLINNPGHWADSWEGETVFRQQCATCHGANGQGQPRDPNRKSLGYKYPPLWGPDSYNDGAGMGRVRTAATFIYGNMPVDNPNLTAGEAMNVAAYIDSQDRPHMADLARDYPDRRRKPFDCPYPPYADNEPEPVHKFGPFPVASATPPEH